MKVFIDTSAFCAIWEPGDPHHEGAKKIHARLAEEAIVYHSHDWVFLETMFLLRKRLGRSQAARAGQIILQNPAICIHAMDDGLRPTALQEHGTRPVSLVDAASFVLMRREGIERAFAFDKDFERAGFTLEKP